MMRLVLFEVLDGVEVCVVILIDMVLRVLREVGLEWVKV